MQLEGQSGFAHTEIPAVGILVTNLGSPDAPTPDALRVYLRQFLSDPRVIEKSKLIWRPILEGIILRRRPPKVAEKYKGIWTDQGAPLHVTTQAQCEGIEAAVRAEIGTPVHARVGMRYGNPSIERALTELRDLGCRRILVFPMLPQYASSSVGSAFDAVAQVLMRWRWIPEMRFINHYHDDPGYITCLATSIREMWERKGGPGEKLVFSFHGIPLSTFLDGDPYPCECHKTGRLVAEALDLAPDRWMVCFQSQFGREQWLEPATDKTLTALGQAGLKRIDILCPGFASDCLETIEEIQEENREIFEENGGEELRYVEALNARPDHLAALTTLALRHLQGWTVSKEEWDEEAARKEREASQARAEAMKKDGLNYPSSKPPGWIYDRVKQDHGKGAG